MHASVYSVIRAFIQTREVALQYCSNMGGIMSLLQWLRITFFLIMTNLKGP